MKPRSSRRSFGAAVGKVAAVGAIIVFAALASSPARAQATGSSDSNWERLDRVLVIPPVYKPAAKAGASANPPSGCGNSRLGAGPGGAIVVAGTADCQNTNTPQTQAQGQNPGSTNASGSSQAAATPPAQSAAPNTDQANSGPPVGTIDEYKRQEEAEAEAAATTRANSIPPPVVVGPPLVPYYLPRRYAAPAPPMTHIYVPTTAFPRAPLATWMPRAAAPMPPAAPAWMPQMGVPAVAARPPIFIPSTAGSFGATSGFVGMGGWHGR